jgi:hypothetical protein
MNVVAKCPNKTSEFTTEALRTRRISSIAVPDSVVSVTPWFNWLEVFRFKALLTPIVVLWLCACGASAARGENIEWTRQLGTSAEDYSYGVSADGLGNVYISGSINGSLGGPNAGGADAFVAKISDPAVSEPSTFLLAVAAAAGLVQRRRAAQRRQPLAVGVSPRNPEQLIAQAAQRRHPSGMPSPWSLHVALSGCRRIASHAVG